MAGRPIKRAIPLAVKSLADEQNMTELAYICSRLASGTYLAAIARELGVSRNMLSTYVNALPGAKPALKEARSEGAHAMVEEAYDILDTAATTPDRDIIAIAKEQVSIRLWSAQRLNRTDFGDDKQAINVNVMNVGSLSLDAMRARSLPDSVSRARLIEAGHTEPIVIASVIAQDAEIVSDDDTST